MYVYLFLVIGVFWSPNLRYHNSFVNTKRESARKGDAVKFKHSQSEIDYIIKHVSGIIQNIFSMDEMLSIDW